MIGSQLQDSSLLVRTLATSPSCQTPPHPDIVNSTQAGPSMVGYIFHVHGPASPNRRPISTTRIIVVALNLIPNPGNQLGKAPQVTTQLHFSTRFGVEGLGRRALPLS